MSFDDMWAVRESRTHRLIRGITEKLITQNRLTPEAITGLCYLTWITKGSGKDYGHGYIKKCKLPGLQLILGTNDSLDLTNSAKRLRDELGIDHDIVDLIQEETGFTNYYTAFRPQVISWIKKNINIIEDIVRKGFVLTSDVEGREIITVVENLDRIPLLRGNRTGDPAKVLTPLLFCLDPRQRFPVINNGIKSILRYLGVENLSLSEKYSKLMTLYERDDIQNAIDIDRMGELDEDDMDDESEKMYSLRTADRLYELKDEEDVSVIGQAQGKEYKRIHNELTNAFSKLLPPQLMLFEGTEKSILFDLLIESYHNERDLLIEAKGSMQIAEIRLAIGQLIDYRRRRYEPGVSGIDMVDLAILLPEKPDDDISELLGLVGIHILWLEANRIRCSDKCIEQKLNH